MWFIPDGYDGVRFIQAPPLRTLLYTLVHSRSRWGKTIPTNPGAEILWYVFEYEYFWSLTHWDVIIILCLAIVMTFFSFQSHIVKKKNVIFNVTQVSTLCETFSGHNLSLLMFWHQTARFSKSCHTFHFSGACNTKHLKKNGKNIEVINDHTIAYFSFLDVPPPPPLVTVTCLAQPGPSSAKQSGTCRV